MMYDSPDPFHDRHERRARLRLRLVAGLGGTALAVMIVISLLAWADVIRAAV